MSQLSLPLHLADHAVFESFLPAGNEALLAYLRELADTGHGGGGWIWGPEASGKSHLLQATCERLGDRAVYLPFDLIDDAGPDILEGVAARGFVCIDDVGKAASDDDWERALFRLCNQLYDVQGTLLVSAAMSLRASDFRMPDLRSRFSQLPAFQLQPLNDEQRVQALQLRSRHRGLELPDESARFLLHRSRRDMSSLYQLLDRLDAEALRAQRRLTVPFVREVLGRMLREHQAG